MAVAFAKVFTEASALHWTPPLFDPERPWVVALAGPAMDLPKPVQRFADRTTAERVWARAVVTAENMQFFGTVIELWHHPDLETAPRVEFHELVK